MISRFFEIRKVATIARKPLPLKWSLLITSAKNHRVGYREVGAFTTLLGQLVGMV